MANPGIIQTIEIGHFIYWEYDYDEYPIQCNYRIPSDGGLSTSRCNNNSIGGHVKTIYRAGYIHPQFEEVFFCEEHNVDPDKDSE